MKYSIYERLEIGRQVYTHELTHKEAMSKYGVVSSSIDNYVQLYKIENGIPVKSSISLDVDRSINTTSSAKEFGVEDYLNMSKEELINELIKSKANELRAKKGYEVKGVGANKEFIPLNKPNSK